MAFDQRMWSCTVRALARSHLWTWHLAMRVRLSFFTPHSHQAWEWPSPTPRRPTASTPSQSECTVCVQTRHKVSLWMFKWLEQTDTQHWMNEFALGNHAHMKAGQNRLYISKCVSNQFSMFSSAEQVTVLRNVLCSSLWWSGGKIASLNFQHLLWNSVYDDNKSTPIYFFEFFCLS